MAAAHLEGNRAQIYSCCFPAILSLCVASLALKVLGFQGSLIERLGEKAKREN